MPTCSVNPAHVYPSHNRDCPWCEAEKRAAVPVQVATPKVVPPKVVPPKVVPPAAGSVATPSPPTPAAPRTLASRRNVKESFKKLGVLILGSLGAWVLTPVVASFGTLVIPGLMTAVFAPDENRGSTAADAPETLFLHLAGLLIFFCLSIFAMDLVFGPGPRFTWLLPVAAVGGLVAFFWQVVSTGGQLWHWNILPIAIVVAYLLAQVLTFLQDRARP